MSIVENREEDYLVVICSANGWRSYSLDAETLRVELVEVVDVTPQAYGGEQ